MQDKAVEFLQRVQAASLMGPYEPLDREEQAAPYVGVGDTSIPYDLGARGVIREVKHALKALGVLAADRHRTSDPAIERRYEAIVTEEEVRSWDAASADEFAIAIGRYRGWGLQVPWPWAASSPGGPQPTATGLELLAGAVNERLGGHPRMVMYEQWRQGTFAPPSRVSGPDADAPIVPLNYFGVEHPLPPASVAPDIAEQIAASNLMLADAWTSAMTATTELERAELAATMQLGRSLRNTWVAQAQARAPEREGTTVVEPVAPEACVKLGGRWDAEQHRCMPPVQTAETSGAAPWIILAVGGVLVAGSFLTKDTHRLSGGLRR